MFQRALSPVLAAFLLTAFAAAPALSQSRERVPVPVNLPPEGFAGEQFVDNAGCTFMRAGFAGATNWVPRFNEDRTPMCGRQPSFPPTPATVVAAAPEATPTPAPQTRPSVPTATAQAAPAAPVRPAPTQPRPMQATPPAPAPQSAPVAPLVVATAADGRPVGAHPDCPANAPFASFGAGPDGVRTMTCHALPGVGGARVTPGRPHDAVPHSPARPAAPHDDGARPVGAHPSCPARAPYGSVEHRADGTRVIYCHSLPRAAMPRGTAAVAVATAQPIPPGYTPVWTDDRLNPHRGVRTAAGDAQMRAVWTDSTPMRLVDEPGRGPLGALPAERQLTPAQSAAIRQPYAVAPAVTATARPAAPASPVATRAQTPPPSVTTGQGAAAGRFVQVASFADPANATRTRAALESRGLPVAQREVRTSGGQTLRVVMAGPFASAGEAQQALATARGLGFRDAYLRR